jgi:hypothetical protein
MMNWEGFGKKIHSPRHDKICDELILLKTTEISGDECVSRISCFFGNTMFSMTCSSKSVCPFARNLALHKIKKSKAIPVTGLGDL